jgi:ribosomal protein S18 acetylase RimI-like enzyme
MLFKFLDTTMYTAHHAPDEPILSYLTRHEDQFHHGIRRPHCVEDQVLVRIGNRSIKLLGRPWRAYPPPFNVTGPDGQIMTPDGRPASEADLAAEMEGLRDLHVFAAGELERVYGLLYMEKSCPVARPTWEEWEDQKERRVLVRFECAPLWVISLIWVCPGHRRQGWARALITTALAYFQLTPEQIGWKPPFSPDGQATAKAICPQSFVIGM